MEISLHKQLEKSLSGEDIILYCGTIYETYTSSKDKKKIKLVSSTSKLMFSIKLAFYMIKNYKWIDTSIIGIESKPKKKKYYNKNKSSSNSHKSNKK